MNDSDLVDDVDTAGHREVDATPPVAAKSLRKGRKRTSESAAVRFVQPLLSTFLSVSVSVRLSVNSFILRETKFLEVTELPTIMHWA